MSIGAMLADFPDGALTGMYGVVVALPAVAICSVCAWSMRRAKRQRAFRAWLIAAGVCAAAWVGLVVAAQVLHLP
jgi:predicted Co/Zn/Cd cation transporter (cation efflux family)